MKTAIHELSIMNRSFKSFLPLLVLTASLIVVASACWHSLEEIHYFKSFYPKEFTVTETFYASGVELIKVTLIGAPFCLIILVSLYLLSLSSRKVD